MHVRKINTNAAVYVLLSGAVIINGQQIAWDRLPLQNDIETQSKLPSLEQVIDSLLVHEPETVIVINDTEEHSINNDRSHLTPSSIEIN